MLHRQMIQHEARFTHDAEEITVVTFNKTASNSIFAYKAIRLIQMAVDYRESKGNSLES